MLKQQIESLLFIANRPLTAKKLAESCDVTKEDVLNALDEIAELYNQKGRGVRLLRNGEEAQLSTAPEASKTVQDFLKDETTGEMTKPSIETLTIVAYRGPIAKAELEQIRGVNCSLILRNLMLRGLVEAQGEHGDPRTTYRVTMDFLRFLGVDSVDALPDYDRLSSHENVTRILAMAQAKTEEGGVGESADDQAEEEISEDVVPSGDMSDVASESEVASDEAKANAEPESPAVEADEEGSGQNATENSGVAETSAADTVDAATEDIQPETTA